MRASATPTDTARSTGWSTWGPSVQWERVRRPARLLLGSGKLGSGGQRLGRPRERSLAGDSARLPGLTAPDPVSRSRRNHRAARRLRPRSTASRPGSTTASLSGPIYSLVRRPMYIGRDLVTSAHGGALPRLQCSSVPGCLTVHVTARNAEADERCREPPRINPSQCNSSVGECLQRCGAWL